MLILSYKLDFFVSFS